jgi:hypothetical protein
MATLVQERKHSDFASADSVQLDQRMVVKILIQSIGIRKEKVRAQHGIELTIFEREDGQRGWYVAIWVYLNIASKEGSRPFPYLPMTFDVAVEVPHVPVNTSQCMGTSSVRLGHDQLSEC